MNPAKWPKVNAAGAKAFADFMVAAETQKTIGGFGVEKFGAPLFFPDAGNGRTDSHEQRMGGPGGGFHPRAQRGPWGAVATGPPRPPYCRGGMELIWQGYREAFGLIFGFDAEVWRISLLSLRISGTATFSNT